MIDRNNHCLLDTFDGPELVNNKVKFLILKKIANNNNYRDLQITQKRTRDVQM
jgi:hypothetical protein